MTHPLPVAGTYGGRHVLVAGSGVAGAASARVLLDLGARVTVLDRRESPALAPLRDAGAAVVIADEPPAELLAGVDEVVVSPGFAPHSPLARAAVGAGLPVYAEPELAWRLRRPGAPAWLGITGTNGKTTTTTMLAAILRAAGLRTAALGNIGEPLVFAANGDFDVLAVELSSFQLHWSSQLAPQAGALLNLADDHLDWHGDFDAYATAKTAVWRAVDGTAVGNLDDPRVAAALSLAPGRRVGVTLGQPGPGQLGVADGRFVDRAFAVEGGLSDRAFAVEGGLSDRAFAVEGGLSDRAFAVDGGLGDRAVGDGVDLGPADGIRPAGAHNVSNALHAAALARAYGVDAAAIAAGLAGYTPEPHRNALVCTVDGVGYVDDSKATNPHAALASLSAYPRIVWVAGGQLKGVDIDDLVASVADRLVGVVLLGVDRAQIANALARHAPRLRVIAVDRTDDDAMGEVVRAAAALAHPGDTVLLAPAAASLDMFTSYAHRGERFAAEVRGLADAARKPAAQGEAADGTARSSG